MADVRMRAASRFVHQGATHEDPPPDIFGMTSVSASTIEKDEYFTVSDTQSAALVDAGLAYVEP